MVVRVRASVAVAFVSPLLRFAAVFEATVPVTTPVVSPSIVLVFAMVAVSEKLAA